MSGTIRLITVSVLVLVAVSVISYTYHRGIDTHIQFLRAAMQGAFIVCLIYWMFEGMREAEERFEGMPTLLWTGQVAYWLGVLLVAELLPKVLREAVVNDDQSGWVALLCWAVALAFWLVSGVVANAHRVSAVAKRLAVG